MPATSPGNERPEKLAPPRAVIFDLDGVITQSAEVHALAWQRTFNMFLGEHFPSQAPFTREADYRDYVDGKPRLAGIRDFLASRQIELIEGSPEDPPEMATLHGLAKRKNQLFRELVASHGVQTFEDALTLLELLERHGIPKAVVSSSRNCTLLLEQAGLTERFAVQIDGEELARRGLAGKPAPDMFLAAAADLGVAPAEAMVLEDARAGVEAGRAGGFGLVVGVDRFGSSEVRDGLFAHGADVVLTDLGKLDAVIEEPSRRHQYARLVDARRETWTNAAVFLDYDGTLAPIVRDPASAYPLPGIPEALRGLAAAGVPLYVISGRDTEVVREFLGLDELVYAGSHGMHIVGPHGLSFEEPSAQAAIPALDAVEVSLRESLASLKGAALERKRFALAVHYRNLANRDDLPRLEQALQRVLAPYEGRLRVGKGKKVFEVRPAIAWDKGRAVLWLIDRFQLEPDFLPLYLGDDLTDEDAFVALTRTGKGHGLLVGDHGELTAAHFRLPDVESVKEFLEALAQLQP